MVTKLENTRDMGKMNLGIYPFLMSDPFCSTEYMAMLVLSLKKPHNVWPQIRYRG